MRKFLQITAMLLLVSMLLVACNHKTPADDTPTGNGESKNGNTVIMVTHNDAIKEMADTVVKLRDGRIRKAYRNENKISAEELEW